MNNYYKCFNKVINVEIYKKTSDMLLFWLKRFCPNIEKIDEKQINKINFKIKI